MLVGLYLDVSEIVSGCVDGTVPRCIGMMTISGCVDGTVIRCVGMINP